MKRLLKYILNLVSKLKTLFLIWTRKFKFQTLAHISWGDGTQLCLAGAGTHYFYLLEKSTQTRIAFTALTSQKPKVENNQIQVVSIFDHGCVSTSVCTTSLAQQLLENSVIVYLAWKKRALGFRRSLVLKLLERTAPPALYTAGIAALKRASSS